MAPRRRDPSNRDIPPNVKIDHKANGTTYYRYVFPDGTTAKLGSQRAEACAAANVLNERFTAAGNLVERAIGAQAIRARPGDPFLPVLIDEFEIHFLAGKKLSDRTRDEMKIKLKEYGRTWPRKTASSFKVLDIAQFLNEKSDHAYIKHRKLLTDLFAFACHQGYREDNPAQPTLKKGQPDRTRNRHTWEGYQAIHAISPDWLQRAMDIALRSLQRRSDLTSLHRSQVSLPGNTITILQQKSRNYAEPVYIEIEMGAELRAPVDACMKSDIPCPYLIHTRPKRISQKTREAKLHPFAVTPNHLTKEFAKYRDLSGAYDHLQPEERPTFHTLRALGIWLYEQAGYPKEYIMALAGHASEGMFKRYKEGHEKPKPVRVQAGLGMGGSPARQK